MASGNQLPHRPGRPITFSLSYHLADRVLKDAREARITNRDQLEKIIAHYYAMEDLK